jgi:hypothetical protein
MLIQTPDNNEIIQLFFSAVAILQILILARLPVEDGNIPNTYINQFFYFFQSRYQIQEN